MDKNKLYLVNWETAASLVNQGGLGIMDLSEINQALTTE